MKKIIKGVLLIIISLLGVVVVGNILDHLPIIVAFDKYFYETINLAPHPEWLNILVAPFNFNFIPGAGTFIPSFLFFIFALGLGYIAIFKRKNFLWALGAMLVALALEVILFKVTNAYVVRVRPFVVFLNSVPESSKQIWLHWPTYPSGHVRDMALYSTVLAGFAPRLFWLFIPLTAWVCYSRIYLGAHYPTDILAGLVLGYSVGWGILLIARSLRQIIKNKKLINKSDEQNR